MKMAFTVKLVSFPSGVRTRGPQQNPFAIQCISEMVQMPKKSKKYGRGQEFCVNIHQKAAPLQWEIQMPFFAL